MESRIAEALQYLHDFPDAKLAAVAREFGISRSTLQDRRNGSKSRKGRTATHSKLSQPEETAICRYIDRLDRINLAVRAEFVTDAANSILRARTSFKSAAIPTVGSKWTSRFLQRRGYKKKLQKKLHSERQSSEDLQRVNSYFNQLQTLLQEEQLQPEDIWNMDETGFRIGVGKDQLIITKRNKAHYFGIPENRESATAIEAISAAGAYIPAFLILAGQRHMARWYKTAELEENTKLIPSETGYSNDEISLFWIQHFQEHTAVTRSGKSGKRRLLILDGHGSHHTIEFIQFCDKNNVIPFGLPPNLTHLLQPLDVTVFQPLKHYQAKALDILVRDGVMDIGKLEFLSYIEDIRKKAFKKETIQSAFKKTGIWPFNPNKVLQEIASRQAERTPSPPLITSSSPFSTPVTLRQVNKMTTKISQGLKNDPFIDPQLSQDISRLSRASIANAAELLQTKRDLGRTQYAKKIQEQRRSLKNQPLQTGGILTVAEGRHMVQKKEENEVLRAQKIIEAAEQRAWNQRKRVFSEAAKKARNWYLTGRLSKAAIYETGYCCRYLKRF
jgi:hypothetical protein